MKKVLLLFLLALSTLAFGQGTTPKYQQLKKVYAVSTGGGVVEPNYYASSSGSGSACSFATPCSISTAIATVTAGQTIGLKGGDVFDVGDVAIPFNNVSVVAYGSGAPVLRGSTDLSAATWTSEAGGFYSTPVASSSFKWLYINDQAARYGQSPWITCNPRSANTNTLTVAGASKTTMDAYNAVQSLVGAKVRIRESVYRMTKEFTITNYNTTTGILTFDANAIGTTGSFFLYGQAQFCTIANDFYYDATAQKVFVKAASSPSGSAIRYGAFNTGIAATSKSGVTVKGVTLKHYQVYALDLIGCNSATVINNTFTDVRGSAIRAVGAVTDVKINNNVIQRSGLNGIEVGGLGLSQLNGNTITDISTGPNLGWPIFSSDVYAQGGCGITGVAPDPSNANVKQVIYQSDISDNIVHDVGYQGLGLYGENNTIRRNQVYNFSLKWIDAGGINFYWNSVFDRSTSNNTIEYNVVYNGIGDGTGLPNPAISDVVGIYIDNRSLNNTIRYNAVYNCANTGILFNVYTSGNVCTNNIVFNNKNNQIQYRQALTGGTPTTNVNNVCTDNVLGTSTDAQLMIYVSSIDNVSTFNPFSGGDCNNTYIPFTTTTICTYLQAGVPTNYDLAGWKTKMGKDATSVSLATARHPYIATNLTASAATITLPAGDHTDIAGNAITQVTLPSFGSQAYLTIDQAYANVLAVANTNGWSLPTTTNQRKDNELVIAWKASGFFGAMDAIYKPKTTGDRNFAKINWKTPGTRDMTEVGTLTFTSGTGFLSDGTTGYLNTNFNPSTNGVNFTLNSGMTVFATANTGVSSLNQYGASSGTAHLYALMANGSAQSIWRTNSNTNAVVAVASAGGFFEHKRTASNATAAFRNNGVLGSSTAVSTSIPNLPIFVLALNSSGSATGFNPNTKDVGFFAIGAPTVSGYPEWLLYGN